MVHLGYLSLPMNRLACGAFCGYIAVLCCRWLFIPGTFRLVPIVDDIFSPAFGMMNLVVGGYLILVATYNMIHSTKLPAPSTGTRLFWKKRKSAIPAPGIIDPFRKLFQMLKNPPEVYIICFALIGHIGVIGFCYHLAVPSYPDSPPVDIILGIISCGALVLWGCAIWHEEREKQYIFDTKVTWNVFLNEAFDVLSKRSIANIIIFLNGIMLVPLTGYSLLKPLYGKTSEYAKYLNQSGYDEYLPTAFLLFVFLFAIRSSYNIAKEGFIAASESLRKTIFLQERYTMTVLSILFKNENIYLETISKIMGDVNSLCPFKLSPLDNNLFDYFRSEEAEKPLPIIAAKWNPDSLPWIPKSKPEDKETTKSDLDGGEPTQTPAAEGSGEGVEPMPTSAAEGLDGVEPMPTSAAEGLDGVEPMPTSAAEGLDGVESMPTPAAEGSEMEPTPHIAAEESEGEPTSDQAAEGSGEEEPTSDLATERSEKEIQQVSKHPVESSGRKLKIRSRPAEMTPIDKTKRKEKSKPKGKKDEIEESEVTSLAEHTLGLEAEGSSEEDPTSDLAAERSGKETQQVSTHPAESSGNKFKTPTRTRTAEMTRSQQSKTKGREKPKSKTKISKDETEESEVISELKSRPVTRATSLKNPVDSGTKTRSQTQESEQHTSKK